MIYVCSLDAFPGLAEEIRPSHVISMLAEADGFPATPACVEPGNHLQLSFDDIIGPLPGYRPPALEHVERLIAFGRGWRGEAPLISHCFAGVSRSSAAAFVLLCLRNPGREPEVARMMRDKAAYFQPNRLMVELADRLLGAEGRMLDSLETMGPADPFAPRGCIALPTEVA